MEGPLTRSSVREAICHLLAALVEFNRGLEKPLRHDEVELTRDSLAEIVAAAQSLLLDVQTNGIEVERPN